MLGNFSFGDYFKEQAIPLAWELVTKDFGLDPKRLLVTIYHDDEDAYRIWKKVTGFSDDKIIRIATSRQLLVGGRHGAVRALLGDLPRPGRQGSRAVRRAARTRTATASWSSGTSCSCSTSSAGPATASTLPRPSIDTGMGLERMTAILQGVQSVYDIDLFKALIAASEAATGVPAKGEHQASHRVIADHLRATSFLIAEGVLPSNVGRGYVLRRIMRRAMRHAHLLGAKEPLMWRLVPALVQQMGETYPELVRAQPLITETLKLEETRFRKTLERGLGLLGEASGSLAKGDVFSGDTAFKLYDTYGFPLDLTQDALKPRGITVDTPAFDAAMQKQKEEARKAWKGSGEAATETVWFEVRERVGATDFLGYDTETAEGEIRAILKDGKEVGASGSATRRRWCSTRRRSMANPAARSATRASSRGRRARCSASPTRRRSWATSSCTSAASRRARSSRAMRWSWSSITRAARPRAPITPPPICCTRRCARCSALTWPRRARWWRPTGCASTSPTPSRWRRGDRGRRGHGQRLRAAELARRDAADGARGRHGDRRDGAVRREVRRRGARRVHGRWPRRAGSCGGGQAKGKANKAWSVELCGGTHVARTGDIGLIKVMGETASAAGVRRIEALTAEGAREYLAQQDARMRELAGALRTRPDDVVERVKALLEERKQLERSSATPSASSRSAAARPATARRQAEAAVRAVGNIKLMARSVQGLNPKDLRGLVDDGKKQVGSGVVAIVGVTEDGKAGLAVGVTEDLTGAYSAVDLVKVGAEALGGKGGGGRPTWPRPAAPTAPRPRPRSRPSRPGWRGDRQRAGASAYVMRNAGPTSRSVAASLAGQMAFRVSSWMISGRWSARARSRATVTGSLKRRGPALPGLR